MVWEATSYSRERQQLKQMFAEIHTDAQRQENVAKASAMLAGSAKPSESQPKEPKKK